AARPAEVVDVVGVFDETLIHVVADFLAFGADEIHAFNGLVDAFAIEDPALELFDADTEEVFVLPFDLAAARFVFREIAVLGLDAGGLILEDARALLGFVLLWRSTHAVLLSAQRVRSV